jgi:hypothetical protein
MEKVTLEVALTIAFVVFFLTIFGTAVGMNWNAIVAKCTPAKASLRSLKAQLVNGTAQSIGFKQPEEGEQSMGLFDTDAGWVAEADTAQAFVYPSDPLVEVSKDQVRRKREGVRDVVLQERPSDAVHLRNNQMVQEYEIHQRPFQVGGFVPKEVSPTQIGETTQVDYDDHFITNDGVLAENYDVVSGDAHGW